MKQYLDDVAAVRDVAAEVGYIVMAANERRDHTATSGLF